ncbi:MAG: hypothetical protein SFT94_04475 [Pseudanabaenaceae cyanobacterium bins.68]|nr:hypothetical protein [Pseudanabaenaceae cyanobacterium bins.68]
MAKGLIWLLLLLVLTGLTALGWREYQKIAAYGRWATAFERHKYDIYAVLGQQGDQLTWGKPWGVKQGELQITNLQTVSLGEISEITLEAAGQIAIALKSKNSAQIYKIPFTDLAIATNWLEYLVKAHGT